MSIHRATTSMALAPPWELVALDTPSRVIFLSRVPQVLAVRRTAVMWIEHVLTLMGLVWRSRLICALLLTCCADLTGQVRLLARVRVRQWTAA